MPLALLLLTYLFIIVDGEDNNTSKSNFKEMRFRFLVETHIPITVSTPKSWQKECSTRTKLLDDNVQRYNMCSIIGRCIGRLKYDKLYTFLLADENNLEIPIFAGDEPFIIQKTFLIKMCFWGNNLCCAYCNDSLIIPNLALLQ